MREVLSGGGSPSSDASRTPQNRENAVHQIA
jgi:hypothetical protein